ncbi:hypothetical protein METBIDRAFT_44199 [Metschnikowia bicuspidata var. bicuspidata NRRL YB-4993]|uniref:TUG ubiquitin-like domain-containing protein n=1 Tax=Metschnikowia bicuspidata var. bicuspidata NRRL YB-4993 TaxID=869754 RepID=A0A1A0H8L6_9ASCO|nr:hypothetical protein METBIDRAFT_44199 [Metschnikowia bicuspidata var. bicuspidata NRRL YB-4993]OBA20459.1 hypothetical protein METBIDRAFT_44199 [Metschnikowia bicuspidata var. bicuspidata NRRL YB-4993]
MSYTFSVAYQNSVKKVTCRPTASVNQLVALLLDKFKLAPTTNGTLAHGSRTLDGLTPVRLAGLVNNATLILKTALGPYEAALKLVGSVDGVPVAQILKVQSDATLPQLVTQLLGSLGAGAGPGDRRVELGAMRLVVRSLQPEFAAMTVGALVGFSPNAVVRVAIGDETAAAQTAGPARRQGRPDEGARTPEPGAASARGNAAVLASAHENADSTGQHHQGPGAGRLGAVDLQGGRGHQTALPPGIREPLKAPQRQETTPELPLRGLSPGASLATADRQRARPAAFAAAQTQITPAAPESAEVWALPVETSDTVYEPVSSTAPYENPAEDYELTSKQAEKYYQMLRAMQGRPAARKKATRPARYTIRIRFPDRTLLDLHFEDPGTKLGQLLKKLDSYLLPPHSHNYRLRNGLPPCEPVAVGFDANNTALHHHPLFQLEKILLIWESRDPAPGPYLKPELQRKDVSELPTVVLDTHRGNLEAEDETTGGVKNTFGREGKETAKPKKTGMPKWFRP